jgi:hypothetical protein
MKFQEVFELIYDKNETEEQRKYKNISENLHLNKHQDKFTKLDTFIIVEELKPKKGKLLIARETHDRMTLCIVCKGVIYNHELLETYTFNKTTNQRRFYYIWNVTEIK